MRLEKSDQSTSIYSSLEYVSVATDQSCARSVVALDGSGRPYFESPMRPGKAVRFRLRGDAGRHLVRVLDAAGALLEEEALRLAPRTSLVCDRGPYAQLLDALQRLIVHSHDIRPWIINGRSYYMLVCWSRDHVYTLKAAKYFIEDVTSGLDYWLDSQEPSGMFWDCIYRNNEDPAPTWLGEALGEGWFKYDNDMKYIVRRVPVLADTEYVFTEGVWYAWKATGDDAWMARQLPRLEKALHYMTSDPLRWSPKHGLVRRSFTADEWDFANPHYCDGDHRCINPGDPTFFFHGNNSGVYSMYWRMAEMYEYLGDTKRGAQLRKQGEALRARANKKLFFGNVYGHMIPESLPEKQVYDLVGDERKRMSLSTGYTINRGMPTHEMAVKILHEYQRRAKANKSESFAEWWTMDPTYGPSQWPSQDSGTAGCPEGEYMNGGICTIVAGEIAKAAFDHGEEAYGADILERVWKLAERDGGNIHQVYKRLPEKVEIPKAKFQHVAMCGVVNRGLKNGATKGVIAWTGEGDNDMRNLPTGRQKFGAIEFDVIPPKMNAGRSILRVVSHSSDSPENVTIPVANLTGRSLYFLHALANSAPRGAVVAYYDVFYADGGTRRIHVREGREIGLWWGIGDQGMDRSVTRRAWWGANPQWKTVGMHMFGWNNPRPEHAITAIRVEALGAGGRGAGVMLGAISLSDQPVAYEPDIRSYGLPDCWAHGAVYYAIAEGLAGIEDKTPLFGEVSVSPRWAVSQANEAQVTLHYPASDAYCSYDYKLDRKAKRITLDLTGSFRLAHVHCLLPAGAAKSVEVDGQTVTFKNTKIEKSKYVDFTLLDLPRGAVTITY